MHAPETQKLIRHFEIFEIVKEERVIESGSRPGLCVSRAGEDKVRRFIYS